MREIFFTLGTLYLLQQLGWSGWWDIPAALIVLLADNEMRLRAKKERADVEAMKLLKMREIFRGK